ncbi:hypothetical protein [Brevibacillus composti]|nr:hypothetical protein [Brevibacillus composti]
MNDKELLVERLKREGFSKSAEKVQREPENKNEHMEKASPSPYSTPES